MRNVEEFPVEIAREICVGGEGKVAERGSGREGVETDCVVGEVEVRDPWFTERQGRDSLGRREGVVRRVWDQIFGQSSVGRKVERWSVVGEVL